MGEFWIFIFNVNLTNCSNFFNIKKLKKKKKSPFHKPNSLYVWNRVSVEPILGIQMKSVEFFMIIFIKVLGGLGGTPPPPIHHFKSKQRPKNIWGSPWLCRLAFLLSEDDKTSELSHDWPTKGQTWNSESNYENISSTTLSHLLTKCQNSQKLETKLLFTYYEVLGLK